MFDKNSLSENYENRLNTSSISYLHRQEWEDSVNEYSITWRNIIFIPFNKFWQYVVMISIIINTLNVMYTITFSADEETTVGVILYYTAWFIYLIDTVLSIAHRHTLKYRTTRAINPKSTHRLAFDVISLIPFYEIYVFIKTASRRTAENEKLKKICRIQSLIRIYSLFLDLLQKSQEIKTSYAITSITLTHHIYLIVIAIVLAALRFSYVPNILNWSNEFQDFKLETNNSMQWWIFTYTVMTNNLIHNWKGYRTGYTVTENLITFVTTLFGFMMHYMVYFTLLLIAYLKVHKMQQISVKNLNHIRNYLTYSKVKDEWYDKTIAYYKFLWDERDGIKNMPKFFKLLPLQLQKEVAVDIYWEAFRHSHLLCNTTLPFKRALSLIMKDEFFLPGDYLYKVKEIKRKMCYIVSGIVQVLTQEDEESPIVSLSSGTVLGEMSCFLPTRSVVNVRCVTYCEFHTLDIRNFYEVLQHYPNESKLLRRHLLARVENARQINEFVQQKAMIAMLNKEDTSIKFIKRQWRDLSNIHNIAVPNLALLTSPFHTSEFLDLLVLSKDIELKTNAICLNGTCPFVMQENSSFQLFVHYLILISVFMQCLIVPYYIAFYDSDEYYVSPVNFILDAFYVLHIYFELSTAIKKGSYLISSSSGIAMEKTRHITFMIDIVATIPFDYFGYWIESNSRTCSLLRLNRLLRFYAIMYLFYELERSIRCDILHTKLLKYFFLNCIIIYWISCITKFISLNGVELTELDLLNIYHSICHYLGTPIGYLPVTTTSVLLWYHHMKLLGYYMFTLCTAEICSIYVERLHKYKNYKYFMRNMQKFMKGNKINVLIRNQVSEITEFWWRLNKNKETLGENGILTDASAEIQNHVFRNKLIACMKGIPLFENVDKQTMDYIVNNCITKSMPPGVTVIRSGKRSNTLYFILQGYCELKSCLPGDYKRDIKLVLSVGAVFPIVEVLHNVDNLTHVVTSTATELLCLKFSFFDTILSANPELMKNVNEAIKTHYQENKHLLHLDQSRLPPMIPQEHSLGKPDLFKYVISDVESSAQEDEYQTPFKQLGKWGFIRYVLFRNTIYSETRKYMCYECFRCVVILIRIILVFIHYNVLINHSELVNNFYHVLNILALIDFYIRMHCQYYTELGILVTHPWYTAKHYLKSSFVIDLIAMEPIKYLKFDEIMGFSRKEEVSCLLSLITAPWQLYRVFGFLDYMYTKAEDANKFFQTLKYIILVMVSICTTALILQIRTCRVQTDDQTRTLFCNDNTWIHKSLRQVQMTSAAIYLKCLYVVVVFFTTSSCGSIVAVTSKDFVLFTVIAITMYALHIYVLARTISFRTLGNIRLTLYRERLKSFLRFIRDEYVDDELITETINYHQYIWDKTQGNNFTTTFNRFCSTLHKDLTESMYGSTMSSVKILEKCESSFLRDVLIETSIVYIKKDTNIIRCNDVQGLIYIVHIGAVNIRIANSTMCTLGTGGVFGCFSSDGMTRQTIDATAKVHTTLLTIPTKHFFEILDIYPNVKQRLLENTMLHSEYEEGMVDVSEAKYVSFTEKDTFIDSLHAKTHILINEKMLWYQWWKYIVYVHVASISSLALMVFIGMMTPTNKLIKLSFKIIIYAIDLIFYLKIFFELHLCYEDTKSGILITDLGMIRRKYTKSLQIWIDVFTCFPFEVFVNLIISNKTAIKYFFLNRVFRFIHLIQYYVQCQEKLYVKMHLYGTYFFYCSLISLQLMTCIWWFTACPNQRCFYSDSPNSGDQFIQEQPGIASITFAYAYIINLFTTVGYTQCAPLTALEVVVSIFILIFFEMTTITLIGQFTSLLEIRRNSQNTFGLEMTLLQTYVQHQQLSPVIVEKLWNYGCQLWTMHGGVQIPEMIIESPPFLQQDLMFALYGRHLKNHFLFKKTHKDFLRQLVVNLKRYLFFPQDFLVLKGDVDGSMYFIHKGIVEVFEVRGDQTILNHLLYTNHTFGEEQLLYNTSHKLSYRAKTVVDVLILTKSDWSYLLNWFPASYNKILQKGQKYYTAR